MPNATPALRVRTGHVSSSACATTHVSVAVLPDGSVRRFYRYASGRVTEATTGGEVDYGDCRSTDGAELTRYLRRRLRMARHVA